MLSGTIISGSSKRGTKVDVVGGVLPGQIARTLTSKPTSVLSCLVSQLIQAVGFLRSAGASKVKVKIIINNFLELEFFIVKLNELIGDQMDINYLIFYVLNIIIV